MPTVRERNGQWQVIIRKKVPGKGIHKTTKTMPKGYTKAKAMSWGVRYEQDLFGDPNEIAHRELGVTKLRELFDEYYRSRMFFHTHKQKKGFWNENRMIDTFRKYEPEMCNKPLRDLTLKAWQGWVDRMFAKGWSGKPIKKSTIDRYLNPIKHIYTIAHTEFNVPVIYPFRGLNFGPKRKFQHRKRTATNEEIQNLMHIADLYDSRSCALWQCLIMTALTTAMRRGELLKIEWRDVNLKERTIEVRGEISKSGEARTLPIIKWLADYLTTYRDLHTPDEAKKPIAKVFGPIYGPDLRKTGKRKIHPIHGITDNGCGLGWQKLCEHAGVPHGFDENGNEVPNALHFHDLRHTALTSFDRMRPYHLTETQREYMGGHGGSETRKIYSHAFLEDIREQLENGFNWQGYELMLASWNPFEQEFITMKRKPHWIGRHLSTQTKEEWERNAMSNPYHRKLIESTNRSLDFSQWKSSNIAAVNDN